MSRRNWAAVGAAALLLLTAVSASAPPASAVPGIEPTATVTVYPTDPTVDASGVNPVDTTFLVNVTGTNRRLQDHTMWVNITFATSTAWRVRPTFANITFALPANGGTDTESVPVTVTVPPKVSANNISIFSAAWTQTNTVYLPTGQSGNATAEIHIRQIYSTAAEFVNGSAYSVVQGQNTNISVRVTNRGNGDALYDAELRNAADLRPSDILLQSTTAATVAQNGTGVVLVVIHANPYAIAGSYQLQIRVLAGGAGTPPPAGAFADLTAQLTVTAAAPPPPQNNTTQPPPPPQNNTTNPPPPPPPPPDAIQVFLNWATTPAGISVTAIVALVLALGVYSWRRGRAAKRERQEALSKARARRGGPGAPGARPAGAPGARPAGAPGAPRPGPPVPGGPSPGAPIPGRPLPPRPGTRMPARPGAPAPRPQAPPPK